MPTIIFIVCLELYNLIHYLAALLNISLWHKNRSFPIDQTVGGAGGMEKTGKEDGLRGEEEASRRVRGWNQTSKAAIPLLCSARSLSPQCSDLGELLLGPSFSRSKWTVYACGSVSRLQGATPQFWSFVCILMSPPISFLKYIVFTAHLIWV